MDNKLVAILRDITPAEAPDHIAMLIEQGFSTLEIPLNSPNWQASISAAVSRFGHRATIGAGTVLHRAEVDTLQGLGAQIIVTPNSNPTVIRHACAAGINVCAGFATPSEAFAALNAGAHWLKLFPAASFGVNYIRAIKAVLPPDVPLLAVGGITPANLADYLAAGCAGAGLGNDLYRAGQPLARTREQARAFSAAWLRAQP